MTKEYIENVNIVAHSVTFIRKVAYSLLKTLAFPENPISVLYATPKELLIDHVKCTNFECCKRGDFHKLIRQDIKNSTTSLRYPHRMRTQGYADNSLKS
ncbi:unnamed protein product [Schistosoma mattheei]|uniref:Uncharacterized protein n=1 Tax=Schistosoma mattheei TaxID=31246 RepID=A0A183PHF2_9TREM|nr:unnamed protein product [Schistosoma mattheei]